MRRLTRCLHAVSMLGIVVLLLQRSSRVVLPQLPHEQDPDSLWQYLPQPQEAVSQYSEKAASPRIMYYGLAAMSRSVVSNSSRSRAVESLSDSGCCTDYKRFYQDDDKWEPACRQTTIEPALSTRLASSLSFPTTCNPLHELDSTTTNDHALLGVGAWRVAWAMHDTVVVKQLRLDKVDGMCAPCVLHKHALDAYLLSRLGPQWAVPLFGHCGNSILVERAHETLEDHLERAASRNQSSSALERLELGLSAARALAALHHAFDSSLAVPTVAWMDVKASNYLMIQGQPKISDLNVALVLRHYTSHINSSNNSICKYDSQKGVVKDFVPDAKMSRYMNAIAVDIYRLGHDVLQQMLLPDLWSPKENNNTMNKQAYVALQHVAVQCMDSDPERRPTSRQVVKLLEAALDKLEEDATTT